MHRCRVCYNQHQWVVNHAKRPHFLCCRKPSPSKTWMAIVLLRRSPEAALCGRPPSGAPAIASTRSRYIDDRRRRAEVERIVMDVLRSLDMPPQLHIVTSDEDKGSTRY